MLYQPMMADTSKTKQGNIVIKVYTNFGALNKLENDIECESFTVKSLFVYKTIINCKYIQANVLIKLQTNKWHYLDYNLFEDQVL